jgi:hypothetical protein
MADLTKIQQKLLNRLLPGSCKTKLGDELKILIDEHEIIRLTGFLKGIQATIAHYYVDCNIGNDSNNGTYQKPFKTISKAISVATAGNTIIIQGGKYYEVVNISETSPSGLKLIGIGDVVIDGLDRNVVPEKFTSMLSQFTVAKDNTHIKNISIINSPCMALRIDGNYCTLENVRI